MSKHLCFRNILIPVLIINCLLPALVHSQKPLKSAHLEHLTIAVPDLLESSIFLSDSLGFTIKMGRLHSNSIENSHVKFKDKSSIEIITAKTPMDDLAAWYINYLKRFPVGAGAFVGIRIDDEEEMNQVEEWVIKLGLDHKRLDFQYSDIIYFGEKVPINTLFFIRYKVDVKDRAAILKHKNTSEHLYSVWLNFDQHEKAAELLRSLGFKVEKTKELNVNFPAEHRFFIGDKPVYIVDSDREERIAGVSIKCEDLREFRKWYRDNTGRSLSITSQTADNSIRKYSCDIRFLNALTLYHG